MRNTLEEEAERLRSYRVGTKERGHAVKGKKQEKTWIPYRHNTRKYYVMYYKKFQTPRLISKKLTWMEPPSMTTLVMKNDK